MNEGIKVQTWLLTVCREDNLHPLASEQTLPVGEKEEGHGLENGCGLGAVT